MNQIINWMGGWPKEGLVSSFDWEERLATAAELSRAQRAAGNAGEDGLKEMLAQGILRDRTEGKESRLRLASGADAVLARMLTRSFSAEDAVLTERPTSRSALQAFRKAGVLVEMVEGDGRGMDPDALQVAIGRIRPRAVYVAPACSDPAGAGWTADREADVVSVCREAGVLLLRDDRQEMLLYDYLEENTQESRTAGIPEGVLSIGQLPPGLVAGLRLGWLTGAPEDIKKWYPVSPGEEPPAEPGLTPLERRALAGLLREQPLEPLIELLRAQCRERARLLIGQLQKRRMEGLRWTVPEGGVNLWMTLPEGLDGESLLRGAWIRGLMFQPGAPFYADNPERNTLRLTFAYADERQMRTGVARLFESMDDFLGRFAGG
jgi:2-aminoadipate transaminase